MGDSVDRSPERATLVGSGYACRGYTLFDTNYEIIKRGRYNTLLHVSIAEVAAMFWMNTNANAILLISVHPRQHKKASPFCAGSFNCSSPRRANRDENASAVTGTPILLTFLKTFGACFSRANA